MIYAADNMVTPNQAIKSGWSPRNHYLVSLKRKINFEYHRKHLYSVKKHAKFKKLLNSVSQPDLFVANLITQLNIEKIATKTTGKAETVKRPFRGHRVKQPPIELYAKLRQNLKAIHSINYVNSSTKISHQNAHELTPKNSKK